MEILDATVITTALPVIAADFNVPAAHLSIGVSAYLVAVTLFIPLSGYAADKFGARTIFVAAIAVFTFASVLCGLSTSLFEFTLSRILQGLGGAMMVPVGRLVVLRDLPKEKLVKTVAIITWPALSAPLLGPCARRLHRHSFQLAVDFLYEYSTGHNRYHRVTVSP